MGGATIPVGMVDGAKGELGVEGGFKGESWAAGSATGKSGTAGASAVAVGVAEFSFPNWKQISSTSIILVRFASSGGGDRG